MVPNHENKGDYYMNPCLSQLIDEIWFQKMVTSEHFFMKLKHQFIYSNKENVFMVPNHEMRGDYYVNPCLSQLTDKL